MLESSKDACNRVRWRCRRGMLELDSMLTRFFDHDYCDLSSDDKVLFEQLLELEDQQLFQWFLGGELVDAGKFSSLIERIRIG